jgi:hypothetical protein
MRNTQAEVKSTQRLLGTIGLMFLLGLGSLAIGAEMLVLSFWESNPILFWIFQGIWFICAAFALGILSYIGNQRKT